MVLSPLVQLTEHADNRSPVDGNIVTIWAGSGVSYFAVQWKL